MSLAIAIVEDHALFGEMLERHCRTEFGCTIALNLRSGTEALQKLHYLCLDLILLDIGLPDIDGVTLATTILSRCRTTRIVVITEYNDPVAIRRLQSLPIAAFLDKQEASLGALRKAIYAALSGKTYFSSRYQAVKEELSRDTSAFDRVLSQYEQQILREIGEGRSDTELADIFHIRPSTAQSRRRDIMNKLDIHSTPKLMRYAITMGFSRVIR